MFRFIVIIGIIFYAVYKIGSLFFRAGAASQQLRDQQRRDAVNINQNQNQKSKRGPSTNVKGEYVDYEEVK
jgi:uncharacterized protein YpmB